MLKPIFSETQEVELKNLLMHYIRPLVTGLGGNDDQIRMLVEKIYEDLKISIETKNPR
jgi:hypothetical protein